MVSEMSNLAIHIVKVRLTRKKSFIMSHLWEEGKGRDKER